MKKVLVASMFVLGLAACGGGGGGAKAALVKACVDDGESSAEECECMSGEFVDNLDPAMLDMIVESTKAEDSDAYMMSKIGELTPEQMTSLMTVTMSAASKCGVEM